MSFDNYGFEIVGSADKANKAIDSTLTNLDRIGPRAVKASQEIQTAMDRAAEYVRKFDAALERPRGKGISEGALRTAQAYQKLAQQQAAYVEQLRREEQMLDSIHGPIQRAYQDIQALNSLLAKGAINAHEFNAKLATIRTPPSIRGAGGGSGFDVASLAGSLPGGSLVAGAIGGGAAGFAQAGVQSAAAAAHQAMEMADAYTNAQNRLRGLTGSTEAAKATYDKLFDSANKTRSGINETAESYVRITNATKSMGISQQQALKFTEHLNMMMSMGGGTAQMTSAAMLQLSQAMASGVLRGDEFNSIMENAQPISMALQAHLHATQGELRKMAEEGKITSKIIYESIEEAGDRTEKAFAQAVPTISQQFIVLKNEISKAVGELSASGGVTKATADAIANLKSGMEAAVAATAAWGAEIGKLGLSFGDLASGGLTGLSSAVNDAADAISNGGDFVTKFTNVSQHMTDQQTVINRVVAEGTGKLNEYSEAMVKQTLEAQLGVGAANAFRDAIDRASGKTDEWRDATDGVSSRIDHLVTGPGKALLGFLTDTQGSIDRLVHGMDPWFDAHERTITLNDRIVQGMTIAGNAWDSLTKKIEKQSAAAKAHNKEMAALAKALLGEESRSARAIREGAADRANKQAEIERAVQKDDAIRAIEDDVNKRAAELIAKNGEKVREHEEKMVNDSIENAQRMKEAWAESAGSIAGDLISAFADADASITDAVEHAIIQLALLQLKQEALKMGGPTGAFLGGLLGPLGSALGGGRNGFDYMSSNAALQAPGFATGGDMMLRGAGQGPDSHLAMWWMTPGETLSVRTAEQRRQAAKEASSAGGVTVKPEIKILMPRGRGRDIVDDSRSGLTTLVKLQEQLPRRRRR